jgi:hypothetical protein
MSVIYEALKKAEELRAAAQGDELQPTVDSTDAMPNLKTASLFYAECSVTSAKSEVSKG